VRVLIAMTPDWALPNSAEEEPVVTEASSSASVPTLIAVPFELTRASPRYPGVTGTPST
jgi:hypothetical protein